MTESKLNTKEWVKHKLSRLVSATVENIYDLYGFTPLSNAHFYNPSGDLVRATKTSIDYILFDGADKVSNIEARKFLKLLRIDSSNHVVLDKIDDKSETFIEVFIREVI
jgi:hypothetical protein